MEVDLGLEVKKICRRESYILVENTRIVQLQQYWYNFEPPSFKNAYYNNYLQSDIILIHFWDQWTAKRLFSLLCFFYNGNKYERI